MSNVLVTGINYWPEQTGIGPYTTQFAEHLIVLGHRVTVVTGLPHYPQWAVDRRFEGERHEAVRAGVRIVRRRHYVPGSQSALRRIAYEATFLASGVGARLTEEPDLVVGVTPSLSGAALARYFAGRCHVPYGVIVQDLMGPAAAQSGIRGGAAASALARRLERATVARADAVAIVSEPFAPYLRSLGVPSDRLMHFPNWSRLEVSTSDRREVRTRLGWDDKTQVVLHSGNMGLKQGLEQALDAARIAERRGIRTRFVFSGDGSQRTILEERAKDLRNVSFLPVQPDNVFADLLAAADVLLLSERPSVLDMSLPSKLTSYFAAGRPVIAAVSPHGATAQEIGRSRGGLVVPAGDPEAVVGALQRLSSDENLCSRLADGGRKYAAESLGAVAALRRIESFLDLMGSAKARTAAKAMKTA